ncbi:tryptase alpha/beta-1-like isoform X2 [Anoplophora glabripennis]|uniref:tryptase alpha/beta-1-like isoform X2 n=1 Tax=Anoplophora glabripennis TaxID=217634 RepID=UPI000874ECAB|nr:tryptase alpha/beta-1-like isoform X2 [Anoplophora glabripennis]
MNQNKIAPAFLIINVRMNLEIYLQMAKGCSIPVENTPCLGYFDVCCNISKEVLFPSTEAPEKYHGCGYQNSGFFPWYAALFYQKSTDFSPSYKCGISLVHSSVILTAAHCINEDGIWSARIGNTVREISKIIIHPEYNKETMQNDIALAILKEPVEISEKINSICIPPQGMNLDNSQCRIISRAADQNDEVYLKMLKVTIIPKDKCLELLRATRLGLFFRLHNSFLCAVTENQRNTCAHDGGSPLVCPVPGQPKRYHQAGIVSWGIGCGEDVPDVYVKVSLFRDWIDAEMVKNGLEITSYRY